MPKKVFAFITLISFMLCGYCQSSIYCDSLYTSIDTLYLANYQDSVNYSYDYYASNAGLSGGVYVNQYITLDSNSVVDSIDIIYQGALGTYVYPTQNYLLDLAYSGAAIPLNFQAYALYNIDDGTDTCQMPIVIIYNGTSVEVNQRLNNETKILCYPNPVLNKVFIESSNPVVGNSFSIYNSIGEEVSTGQFHSNKQEEDLSSLPNGLYLVEVYDAKKQSLFTKKLLKQ